MTQNYSNEIDFKNATKEVYENLLIKPFEVKIIAYYKIINYETPTKLTKSKDATKTPICQKDIPNWKVGDLI